MYSPQLIEMLAPDIQHERLANAERRRLAYTHVDDRHAAGPSVVVRCRRALAAVILALRARPIPAPAHAD